MVQKEKYYYGKGKRKSAVARVRLYSGDGPIVVNDKPIEESLPWDSWQQHVNEPFRVTQTEGKYWVSAKVSGGGAVGQAGAIRHGIARALQEANPALRSPLKRAGLLVRDSRFKERKKYGLKRARKAEQYTKR